LPSIHEALRRKGGRRKEGRKEGSTQREKERKGEKEGEGEELKLDSPSLQPTGNPGGLETGRPGFANWCCHVSWGCSEGWFCLFWFFSP
jgi:hypothetical protein